MDRTGKVTIQIEIIDQSPTHTKATAAIRIRDTGCGMSEETKQKIFNPFFTTKDVSQGTGLGLSSALGIIQSMRGTIHVTSELGKGSEFSVFLPLGASSDTAPREAAA